MTLNDFELKWLSKLCLLLCLLPLLDLVVEFLYPYNFFWSLFMFPILCLRVFLDCIFARIFAPLFRSSFLGIVPHVSSVQITFYVVLWPLMTLGEFVYLLCLFFLQKVWFLFLVDRLCLLKCVFWSLISLELILFDLILSSWICTSIELLIIWIVLDGSLNNFNPRWIT